MNRKRAALLLVLALAGCLGEDGGSRGTGVTTVQGNVALVRAAARPEPSKRSFLAWVRDWLSGPAVATARSAVEGITVQIEGTPFVGVTDPNGLFAVGGDFSGPVPVLFQRADDGTTARVVVDVPARGVLTLNNTQLNSRSGRASAERQDIAFHGLVVSTNCRTNVATFVSRFRPDDGNDYDVRLGSSALRDQNGAPLSCGDLRGGDAVRVAGVVNRDGTIGAVDAQVEDEDDSSGPGGGGDDDGDDDDNSGPGGGDDDEPDDDSGPGGGDD